MSYLTVRGSFLLILLSTTACGVAFQMPEIKTIKDDFDGYLIHSTFTNQLRDVDPSGNVAELNVSAGKKDTATEWEWSANIRLSRQAGWPELKGLRIKVTDSEIISIDQCKSASINASAQGYGHISHLESITCQIDRGMVERLTQLAGSRVRFDATKGADATLDKINTDAIREVINRVDNVSPPKAQ